MKLRKRRPRNNDNKWHDENAEENAFLHIVFAIFDSFLIFIQLEFIQIHYYGYFIWPLCIILFWQLVNQSKKSKFRLATIAITSIVYFTVSYSLVLDKEEGIVFDPNPFINLSLMTVIVLVIGFLLFIFSKGKSLGSTKWEFIGFSSCIPWLIPPIIEIIYLIRWSFEGIFFQKTVGKAIGGGGDMDVLFFYGFLNFIGSSIIVFIMSKFNLSLKKGKIKSN